MTLRVCDIPAVVTDAPTWYRGLVATCSRWLPAGTGSLIPVISSIASLAFMVTVEDASPGDVTVTIILPGSPVDLIRFTAGASVYIVPSMSSSLLISDVYSSGPTRVAGPLTDHFSGLVAP